MFPPLGCSVLFPLSSPLGSPSSPIPHQPPDPAPQSGAESKTHAGLREWVVSISSFVCLILNRLPSERNVELSLAPETDCTET